MTARQVSYHRFHRRDWDKVRQFLLGEGEAPERLPRILAAEDTVAWLAVDGRDVVGWTLTYPLLAEDSVERGGVENLVVARSHRRRGIGRRLVELAEAYYRRKCLAGMQLTACPPPLRSDGISDRSAAPAHVEAVRPIALLIVTG